MVTNRCVTLQEALGIYASTIKAKDVSFHAHQHLLKFVNWLGADKDVSKIKPLEIGEYGQKISGSGPQSAVHLREVKKFLQFVKQSGFIDIGLAQHVRIGKINSALDVGSDAQEESGMRLTPGGYRKLTDELEKLKATRVPLALQIKQAAADKDVRENAPLEAAREQLGHTELRIREVEEILKGAVVVTAGGKGDKVALGSTVVVREIDSQRETKYTIVSVPEVNAAKGKISNKSPMGKVLLGRSTGVNVVVETPRGKLQYSIVRIL